MTLQGLVVVVVGTSPNLGSGIATALAHAGATVVCVDREEAHSSACAAELSESGQPAVGMMMDATDEVAVDSCVGEVVHRFGSIGGLVNAAAFYDERSVLEMPTEAWRRQLDVILTSTFLFTKYTARAMIASAAPGSIVNVASTAGHQGQPGNIAYSTAKAGILNFTRAAAMDLAPHRIRVNSLTPTSTDPAEAYERARAWGLPPDRWQPTERSRRRQSLLPLGRAPSPSDYGAAVAFLMSQSARAMTGSDLRVDAGAVARYWAAFPGAADAGDSSRGTSYEPGSDGVRMPATAARPTRRRRDGDGRARPAGKGG